MTESQQTVDGSNEQETSEDDTVSVKDLEVGDEFYKHKLDQHPNHLESDYFAVSEESKIVICERSSDAMGMTEVIYTVNTRLRSGSVEAVNGFEMTDGISSTVWKELYHGNQGAIDLYHLQEIDDGVELHFKNRWSADDEILVVQI